ncbi:MAG: hypothetical protein PUP91_35735 [Rhizonema sp. PD37]|nr:hypothetical protein [Rhizonema sp. PD37]
MVCFVRLKAITPHTEGEATGFIDRMLQEKGLQRLIVLTLTLSALENDVIMAILYCLD